MLPRSLRLNATKLNQIKFPDLGRWLPGQHRNATLDPDGAPQTLSTVVPFSAPRSDLGRWLLMGGAGLVLVGTAYQVGRSSSGTPAAESLAAAPALETVAPAAASSTAATATDPASPETTALLQSLPQFEPQGLPPIPTAPSVAVPSTAVPTSSTDPASRVEQRLAEAPRGRANPFAGFVINPENVTVKTVPPSAPPAPDAAVAAPAALPAPAPIQAAPIAAPPQPIVQTVPLAPPPIAPVASVPVSSAPVVPESPTALAESLDIKGMVQLGGQLKLIIKEAGATSTRTVQVGDRVAGGRVLIRKIEVPDGGSPQVTLEQNGKTIVRTVS